MVVKCAAAAVQHGHMQQQQHTLGAMLLALHVTQTATSRQEHGDGLVVHGALQSCTSCCTSF